MKKHWERAVQQDIKPVGSKLLYSIWISNKIKKITWSYLKICDHLSLKKKERDSSEFRKT